MFVAFLPTVGFPFVVSTAGASFFSAGFVCNFVVATISFACALVNSDCFVALLKVVFASSKAAFNRFTLSSVLEAYVPLANFPSISSINFVKAVLFRVSFELPPTSPFGLFSTFAAESEVLASLVDTPVVDELLGIRGLGVCLFSFTLTTF